MKTLGEFLQRLEDDSVFEKKAQAFNQGDELMAFVKREGYDFTLEQLTSAFQERANLPPRAQGLTPAPPDASAPTPAKPEAAAFARSRAALPPGDTSKASPNQGSADLPREQAKQELQELKEAMPPKDREEKSLGGLFRGGGGRHRGFSSQRLKNVLGEDS